MSPGPRFHARPFTRHAHDMPGQRPGRWKPLERVRPQEPCQDADPCRVQAGQVCLEGLVIDHDPQAREALGPGGRADALKDVTACRDKGRRAERVQVGQRGIVALEALGRDVPGGSAKRGLMTACVGSKTEINKADPPRIVLSPYEKMIGLDVPVKKPPLVNVIER